MFFGTILARMILWELCKVFLMALVAITGILLLASLIAEATQQGLGPSQILAAIPLLIPSTLPYTIPATTLFATCVVYGRLSADNEILAIKAAGVNLIHVVAPAVALGVIISAATFALYVHLIPSTHFLLRAMVIADSEELLYTMLKRNRYVNYPKLRYSMFVRGVEGRKLITPIFKRKNEHNVIDIIARAREADLQVDVARGVLILRMRFGVVLNESDGTCCDFQYREFEMELPKEVNENVRPRDLTWVQLGKRRVELLGEQASSDQHIHNLTTAMEKNGLRDDYQKAVKELEDKQAGQTIQHIYVEKLMRPALSLGCLCFILVGCPVGIWFSRGDYLSAFITCFLPVVLVYYPLMLCGTNMAKDGRLNEVAMVFGADAVIGVAGLMLFRRLLRN